MKLNKKLLSVVVLGCSLTASAQNDERISSSLYLQADTIAQVTLPFSTQSEGRRFNPTWGLDQAWIWDRNLRCGVNHMGKENVGIGRTAYRFDKALTGDSVLSSDAIRYLRQRSSIFDIVNPELPLVFTADQEAGADEYFVKNKSANVQRWATNINSHVHWMQQNTKHPIVGISPFNEPDYWTVEEGATVSKSRDVAKLLKESFPRCKDIAIVGGNTLNNDKALEWYNGGKQYYDWGNTHQLAGSMANYIKYYQQLQQDGKVGYNDEMHNVAEAMIGLEYGMTVGIWWGFDSRARGEFCDISRHGRRLAYAEHRSSWTSASVYQHDDGRVKAFIGSSERQANTADYQLLSLDREVYYDGRGPVRELRMQIPGGTGYQTGQTNAERVIDVTWGDDVPLSAINGTYRIVNKNTETVVAYSSGNIVLQKPGATKNQNWNIRFCNPRTGGDYSFYDIESTNNRQMRMNVLDNSPLDNANVIAYDKFEQSDKNEQWYLEYAGNGYYYIRNRLTALYLSAASDSRSSGTNVRTNVLQPENLRGRQLWRLLPVDVTYETTAPAKPEELTAEAQQASVKLSWTPNTESDVEGYMLLRAEKASGQWNTIARHLTSTTFVDNTCRQGIAYIYKVKAIDRAQNQSECSETAEAQPTGEQGLMARWTLNETLQDESANLFDAASHLAPVYTNGPHDGEKALNLGYGTSYVQLPYEVADCDELTISMWVNWRNSTNRWQRIFDFGSGTDRYIFLTPANGNNVMRLALKNGGDEQVLDCTARLPLIQWKHVTVTLGRERTAIYLDGEEVASTTGITIRPSDIHPVLNYIGRSQYASDAPLKAYVADVRIFNYALDAEAVKALANDDTSGIDAPAADAAPATRYTLDGRKATAAQRGIVIENNRKVVVK